MYKFIRLAYSHPLCVLKAFYALRTQGLKRIFGLAFFIKRKNLRCGARKATLMGLSHRPLEIWGDFGNRPKFS